MCARSLHTYTRVSDLCAQKWNISPTRQRKRRLGRWKFFSEIPAAPANMVRFCAHGIGRLVRQSGAVVSPSQPASPDAPAMLRPTPDDLIHQLVGRCATHKAVAREKVKVYEAYLRTRYKACAGGN